MVIKFFEAFQNFRKQIFPVKKQKISQIVEKVYLVLFSRTRKGLGNDGQHICCANASHKWLSALLGGV